MTAADDGPCLADGTPVAQWVVERGLLGSGLVWLEVLDGGVSSLVVVVHGVDRTLVVKQPLDRLRVEREWRADTNRVCAEAAALRLAGDLTPTAVPALLDLDEERRVAAIAHVANRGDWRTRLLDAGPCDDDVGVASAVGAAVARWHGVDAGDARLRALELGSEPLAQLRTRPYHRSTAAAVPDCADALLAIADELDDAAAGRGACRGFVHGDLSPKNVLVGVRGSAACVVDFEVAHVGAPVFDLAFLTTHLLLKSIHRRAAPALQATATAFFAAYGSERLGAAGGMPAVARHTGALLLARVHGRSPATYLDASGRERAERLGRRLLDGSLGDPSVAGVWAELARAAR